MHIQTYRGPTTREVLAQVRSELGDDALVLETREVTRPDGTRELEVVAAIDQVSVGGGLDSHPTGDYSGSGRGLAGTRAGSALHAARRAAPNGDPARAAAARAGYGGLVTPRSQPGATTGWPSASAAVAGLATATAGGEPEPSFDELAFLATLEREVGGASEHAKGKRRPRAPNDEPSLFKLLLANEIRPAVARNILRRARDQGRASRLGEAMRDVIGTTLGANLPAIASTPRTITLIGPTGVGKTTTAAKLAARLMSTNGQTVGLIAADPFRIGAFEQLGIYADLLGVPSRVAHRPEDVDTALDELGACDWIIIDTQGRSPREAMSDTRWQSYLAEARIESLLVLAANTREPDLDAAVDAFWGAKPSGLVFTKVDESSRLGAVLNQAVRTRLPVAFLTNGQGVPEDLVLTTPAAMTEMVLGGMAA